MKIFFFDINIHKVGKDDDFAEMIWERLIPFLQRDDIEGIKPYGFDNQGVWSPKYINPCIRFSKYQPGDHFSTHRDGGFVVNDDLRSVYTLMIYLNSGYPGGETEILSDGFSVSI